MCFSLRFIDINECKGQTNCHWKANCTNTIGSYDCTCKRGMTGDGYQCEGKVVGENNIGMIIVVEGKRLMVP